MKKEKTAQKGKQKTGKAARKELLKMIKSLKGKQAKELLNLIRERELTFDEVIHLLSLAEEKPAKKGEKEILIEGLGLPKVGEKALLGKGITTLQFLVKNYSSVDIRKMKGVGSHTLVGIDEAIKAAGMKWMDEKVEKEGK